ncbi:MAG TPA: zinc-dependent metalloprotease [Actinomycetota bacterium]|nr:zinc-dependent metalloprotease [Actinomycetota bacterium]
MAQEPFGDIPLFREIQRILSSSEGPVNFEIGRQVANALATEGRTDTDIDPSTTRSIQTAIGEAERLVAGYTRRSFEEPIQAEAIGKGTWVENTLKSWRWLLEHLAGHFTSELAKSQPEEAAEANMLQGAMGQIAPLPIGVQAGTLVGHLARAAIGRYDFPIPRENGKKIFFVLPNLEQLASDYSLKIESVLEWMAVHESARHLVMTSEQWVPRYLKSLLLEVVDATEIDTGDLERRLLELQTKGMEGLQDGMNPESQLPVVSTERHRKALERLKAFVAAVEGYGAHVETAVAPELVEDAARVQEGVNRFRASNKEVEAMLGSVLGISLDRDLEEAGATFCAAVVSLKGLQSLNLVWAAPDNLPTLAEIKDPFSWMERVLEE